MTTETSAMSGVEMLGVWKRYGETNALAGLDIRAPGNHVLGIAGPNGAGKSTMIKILAGEAVADGGEMRIDGKSWTPALGASQVAVVHQEPQLFPNLTAMQNLLVGREPSRTALPRGGPVERRLLDRLGILAYADERLGALPLAVQQRVEIARALVRNARVVLFDEPNSALTTAESDELFAMIHSLAAEGHAVILVSHRLGELVAHVDEVAVILDGRCAMILGRDQLTEENIARAITVTGAGAAARGSDAPGLSGPTGLSLRDWCHTKDAFGPLDLVVQQREVVAIVGVEGSGGRELVRSIAGFEPASGDMVMGDVVSVRARWSRVGYIPPDRRAGLFFNLDIGDNIVSRLFRPIRTRVGLKASSRARTIAREWITSMSIKTRGPDSEVSSLSGGNQQKVLIAAAMASKPEVLVLEEPTRGVDIGSKREIYSYLRDYAVAGAVVILYCTEVPEVFEVADRVHVMSNGRLSPAIRVRAFANEQDLAAEVARQEVAMASAEHARTDIGDSGATGGPVEAASS